MFFGLFKQDDKRILEKYQELFNEIEKHENLFKDFLRQDCVNKTAEFKKRIQDGENLDNLIPEAFALTRLGAHKTLNQRHFDVQIIGGLILHQGKIAEMRTGEGKTLVATLPAYLNALSGDSVHIVTVNDYLAQRDAVWMGQVYDYLGLKVGCLTSSSSFIYDQNFKEEEKTDETRDEEAGFKVFHEFLRPSTKQEVYSCDVIYGTNSEFGFDYLRDNLAYSLNQQVQARRFTQNETQINADNFQRNSAHNQRDSAIESTSYNFAIIDEVDSILIDEARTPLIISASHQDASRLYRDFASLVGGLKENEDFDIDEKLKAVTLTEEGIKKVEKLAGNKIYQEGLTNYIYHLELALKARYLYKKDIDYVVKEGQIIIIDEFTGRLLQGRRFSAGLHQAIEAKERVEIQKESLTVASITFQNYFRMYKKLAGMTGTAATSAEEFDKVYGLDVVKIPTNKPMIREDLSDRVYGSREAKYRAVVEKIKELNSLGRPVLVGTISIGQNEYLGKLLTINGIQHNVLNAKNHEAEGQTIAQAGKLGAITIATNMAGRGVDIVLGGNPASPEEAQKVKDLGGLFVLGTERHEARRIDNQLRGRTGRQGDPGTTQFFVSLEDDLLRIFGSDRLKNLMKTLRWPEDIPIEARMVSKSIEAAQSKIEGFHFDARKHVLEYDNVINIQRKYIYQKRNSILRDDKALQDLVRDTINNQAGFLVDEHINENGEIDPEALLEKTKAILGNHFTPEIYEKCRENLGNLDAAREFLQDLLNNVYSDKLNSGGDEYLNVQRQIILQTIDHLWMIHLDDLEQLHGVVNLRAYGQRDPLVEYKYEAHEAFDRLKGALEEQIFNLVFKIETSAAVKPQTNRELHLGRGKDEYFTKQAAGGTGQGVGGKKIGRNDPCFCGSGKKFKKCHGS